MSDLRERLIDVSAALVAERGVGGLSLREVARRAGVSRQAPYHYFADREAMLAAVAEEGFRRLVAAFDAVPPGGDAVARLGAAGRAYVRWARENPAHFRIVFRPELVDLERFPAVLEVGADARGRLDACVAALVAEGRVDPGDAAGVAALAWSTVHGAAALELDGPGAGFDADGAVDALTRLAARPPAPPTR